MKKFLAAVALVAVAGSAMANQNPNASQAEAKAIKAAGEVCAKNGSQASTPAKDVKGDWAYFFMQCKKDGRQVGYANIRVSGDKVEVNSSVN